VVHISKKEIITIVLVVLTIAAVVGISIAFSGGTAAEGMGGDFQQCH
jgi:hypothetical protein